jgi:hypothetical protein
MELILLAALIGLKLWFVPKFPEERSISRF